MILLTSKGIRELADSLAAAAIGTDSEIQKVFEDMGPRIADLMRRALAPHRYTGELAESVTWEYKSGPRELHVGSDLTRRNYNALSLLEGGAKPNAAVPFTPIAKWAEFKGLPAGPIWMSIKTRGVEAHPIREPLMISPAFVSLLDSGAKKLGENIVIKALTYEVGVNVT